MSSTTSRDTRRSSAGRWSRLWVLAVAALLFPLFGAVAAVGTDGRLGPTPKNDDSAAGGGPILDTPEEALRADAAVLAKAEGLSEAEAVSRLEFQVETTAWLNELDERDALGDDFAGSRVSLEDRELTVYFKGKAPIEASALERGSVRVVEGQRYSLADLESMHQHIADAAADVGFNDTAAWVDLETQRFTVEVSEGDVTRASLAMSSGEAEIAVRSALRDNHGVDFASSDIALTVRSGPLAEPSHSYGGAEVAQGSWRKCTSGFTVEDGATGILTAGHCEGINNIADYGNGSLYSTPFMREYVNSKGDFEYHTTSHWEYAIFYTTTTNGRTVGSRIANNAISEDTWACRFGRTTGQSCGYTDSISASVSFTWAGCSCTRVLTDMVSVRGNTTNDLGGDSGGPWWIWTGALGIHWGHYTNNSSIQLFSKIQNAEDKLNVDVVIG